MEGSGPTVTVCAQGCDYATIQSAADAVQPGWIVEIRAGTYTESPVVGTAGVAGNPITFRSYPGESPTIVPSTSTGRFEVQQGWQIVEDLDIEGAGMMGIQVLGDHVTLRRNHIHDQAHAGIILSSASNVLTEDNVIERIGLGADTLRAGILLSDFSCTGMQSNTTRGNQLSDINGQAIIWDNQNCDAGTVLTGDLAEANLIVDANQGLVLIGTLRDSTLRNNTVAILDPPLPPDGGSAYFIFMHGTRDLFENNLFYSQDPLATAFYLGSVPDPSNRFDFDLWDLQAEAWPSDAGVRQDFTTAFPEVTGWESHGLCCQVNPGFVSDGGFALAINSPARGAGDPTQCASLDVNACAPAAGSCDIGAEQYP